ncbi:MAG: hypothetical protein JNK14_07545 [Chitinophagaceae bacterium]|nr:hypothetical protein [Chitinophagaceae bacterium]
MTNEVHEFYMFSGQDEDAFNSENGSTCFPLYTCAGQVIATLTSAVQGGGHTLINDVYADLYVCTHKETLTEILTRLCSAVMMISAGSIIHISAKSIGNITLIHFKGDHVLFSRELTHRLQQTEALVERLGGCITVSNSRQYGIDLAFTFVNH